ncbi:MAG TPA: UDP-3-O-acyl-N-acetylglucosamine deacetylase [Planctomycetia bacterium]|nr:UDP-3-O-acyl-N-acetylglucosamine deacetylase [Planctomycetia bacterium]
MQRTLARPAELHGAGFFFGRDVVCRLLPAAPDAGRTFVRTDLPGRPRIPATIAHRVSAHRRTALAAGGASVEMTEHVLAALVGLEIDNCTIEVDGPELPALDGSAAPVAAALAASGFVQQSEPRRLLSIYAPVAVTDGAAAISIHRSPGEFSIHYRLEVDHPGIGVQEFRYLHSPRAFLAEIAPARSFIRAAEVEGLRALGIGARMTVRDLLVFGDDGAPVENALRYPDECVRHKILDCLGDLALVGRPLYGAVRALRTGHATNGRLAAAILAANSASAAA